jgi:hypothetical protein
MEFVDVYVIHSVSGFKPVSSKRFVKEPHFCRPDLAWLAARRVTATEKRITLERDLGWHFM